MDKLMDRNAEIRLCGLCQGKGSTSGVYTWSDGPSMVEYRCDLCRGSGEIEEGLDLLIRLRDAERERDEAQSELAKLRTYCGLYFDSLEGRIADRIPDPDRKGYVLPDDGTTLYDLAPNPSSYASTWEPYLREAGRLAPRRKSEYASGWQAALDGKPLPPDASELFTRAYRYYHALKTAS